MRLHTAETTLLELFLRSEAITYIMKTIFLLTVLFLSYSTFAQDSVIVHKDPRVDVLVKRQSSINKSVKKASVRTMRGYRLLVVNTNKREEAMDAKTKIYTYFPDLKAYLSYQSPYFKLKAGNFKTRDEAEKYKKTMTAIFPKGVFIINDIIEVKPETDEETD